MLFNRVTTIACFIAICITAQQRKKILTINLAMLNAKDFDIANAKIIDSDAAAVIYMKQATTHFVGNKKGWFSYVFTCTKRIKIINKRAFDSGNS